jgi:2',3'-cyclic-nucleotide 2'-phosphodiesterase (5'-nucleotidase family)
MSVGFIGLTSDIVPRMSETLATGFAFVQDEADYLQLLTTHAQQLRSEGAMAVVVLSELGLHKNWRIARDLPPGVLDVVPPVNLTEPLSGQTRNRPISDIVGFVQEEWSRTNALDNQFNRVFAEMLRQRTGSDLAMSKGFRFGATIPAAGAPIDGGDTSTGAITIEDVYQFFPAIFTFATGDGSGALVRSIIETGLTGTFSGGAFQHEGGWTVSGTLCAYTGFSATTPFVNPATQSPWTNVDLLVDALSTNEMSALVDGIMTDTNATPLRPVGEYFQPLEILSDRLFSDDFE